MAVIATWLFQVGRVEYGCSSKERNFCQVSSSSSMFFPLILFFRSFYFIPVGRLCFTPFKHFILALSGSQYLASVQIAFQLPPGDLVVFLGQVRFDKGQAGCVIEAAARLQRLENGHILARIWLDLTMFVPVLENKMIGEGHMG